MRPHKQPPVKAFAVTSDLDAVLSQDRNHDAVAGHGSEYGGEEARPERPPCPQRGRQHNEKCKRGQHQPECSGGQRGNPGTVAGVDVEPDERQQRSNRKRRDQCAEQGAAFGDLGYQHDQYRGHQDLDCVVAHLLPFSVCSGSLDQEQPHWLASVIRGYLESEPRWRHSRIAIAIPATYSAATTRNCRSVTGRSPEKKATAM